MVGLYCRGRLLQSVRLKKGETEAVLNPEAGAGGVCRVTVFEETTGPAGSRERPQTRELKPVAERLIYRRPAEQLTVHLHPDRSSYVPGQRATLAVDAENEKGEPAPAVVMLAVVDKSVLTLADEKTYRSMPTHFLLTSEVRRAEDLEYADFLLGPQDKAKDALDLLLGVQGWRRFAEQDPAKFREKNIDKEEAERLLVMSGQSHAAQGRPGRGRDQKDRAMTPKPRRLPSRSSTSRRPPRPTRRSPTPSPRRPSPSGRPTRTRWNSAPDRGAAGRSDAAGRRAVLPRAGSAEPAAAGAALVRRRGRQHGADDRGDPGLPNRRDEARGARRGGTRQGGERAGPGVAGR